jgi:hypothetical protein
VRWRMEQLPSGTPLFVPAFRSDRGWAQQQALCDAARELGASTDYFGLAFTADSVDLQSTAANRTRGP